MANDINQRKERPKRTPLGTRNKLTVRGLKDTDEYVYRWVNDHPGRISDLYEAGYDIVDKDGKSVGDGDFESASKVGTAMTKGVGMGVTAYLMKIPRTIWEMDRKERVDKPADAVDEALKSTGEKGSGTYGKVDLQRGK